MDRADVVRPGVEESSAINVLCVDNEGAFGGHPVCPLKRRGFDVVFARTAADALRLASRSAPDIALLD